MEIDTTGWCATDPQNFDIAPEWKVHFYKWLDGEDLSKEFKTHMNTCRKCRTFVEAALNIGMRKKAGAAPK